MRCPDCGQVADDASVFCPHCRYQFRDLPGEDPAYAADTIIDLPERGIIADETVLEEVMPHVQPRGFTEKERRQLEVHLIQPSVLVVLIIALFSYTLLAAVPFVPLTIAGAEIGIAGMISLAAGIAAGLIFNILMKRSLRKFRYQ